MCRAAVGCFIFVLVASAAPGGAGFAFAADAAGAAVEPVPPDVVDAMKSLKAPAEPARQKAYALLESRGDARLIPALKAFSEGTLQLRGDSLVLYGPPQEMPDKTRRYPVLDALTGQPIAGADGKPVFDPKLDLAAAFKKPLTASARESVNRLVASLSLLSPDPQTKLTSVREVTERAARVFPDAATSNRLLDQLRQTAKELAGSPEAVAAIAAAEADRPAKLTDPAPGAAAVGNVITTLNKIAAGPGPAESVKASVTAATAYRSGLDDQKKKLEELARYATALKRLRDQPADGNLAAALREAGAGVDIVFGDHDARLAAVKALGAVSTSRAENLLRKTAEAARRGGDAELAAAAEPALAGVESYQGRIKLVKNTFDGLSSGSILVLLALGLSIVFGLMGVINMAHGEFMMLGAFATYQVSELFKQSFPAYFDYYPIVAVPAAFALAAAVGLVCEYVVVRHLYGRPLETLLATWGIGLILVQEVRRRYGDTLSVTPPRWMSGSVEVMPDLNLGLNRIFIVVYCVICIALVYFLINRTRLGLLLRATTQNREMAAALGVGTRRVDAVTFAFGAGLAGLAGVAVPMYDKINPGMGADYVVESFMVVVVGGVGKLAGAVWAGFGLGFVRKYLEPALQYIPAFGSSASVISRVIVLGLVVAFLQWRPAGLFPPKGRLADAA